MTNRRRGGKTFKPRKPPVQVVQEPPPRPPMIRPRVNLVARAVHAAIIRR